VRKPLRVIQHISCLRCPCLCRVSRARTVQLRPRQTMEVTEGTHSLSVYPHATDYCNQYMYADCNEQSVSRLCRACAYATSY